MLSLAPLRNVLKLMLVPRSAYSTKVLQFGTPPNVQLWGRAMALGTAASAAILLLFSDVASPKREVILGVLAAGFIVCLGFALCDTALTLHLDTRTFQLQRGFAPFRRLVSGPITSIAEVAISSLQRTNLYGEFQS